MDSAQPAQGNAGDFPVVGIGSSAGGIAALQTLFKGMPAKPNLAFVVMQHLTPDQPSQLAALLASWTAVPVHEACEGMRLACDRIFVAPPGHALALEDGVFATRALERAGARAGIDTIDAFLESLAADCGPRAVAVVLSGTGADGAAGAVRVKQAGGMLMVQEPVTAMHDAMPRAAIATGAADHILPLPALARELLACAAPGYVRSATAASWADDVTRALDSIVDMIRANAGFDLSGYKTAPVLWRIQRRMELRRVPLLRDYEALLHDDPVELETLIRGIPIHVTEFFRNPEAWGPLRENVVPRLLDEAGDGPVRAWTPACATGEEAYSLAMLLAEEGEAAGRPASFQIFATDVAADVVARAGRGIFKPAAVKALSAQRRHRFFYAADGAFRVKRVLRERMVFAPQDLLADPPFADLDLVTCRNLLIYLEPDAARRVIHMLHASLRMGGCLFLGKGEALSPKQRGFEEVGPATRIYRKIGPAADTGIAFPRRPSRPPAGRRSRRAVDAPVHEAAAAQPDVPALLVDDQFQIIRLYGETRPFLRFRPGTPTLNLLDLLTPSIGVPLETAARQALADRRAVAADGLADPLTGALTLGVRVTPLDTSDDLGSRLLVSFIRGGSAHDANPPSDDTTEWSEALRISREELEASREELQAVNEELRASNDQLNLAVDDLAAANAQLLGKIDELETQSNVLSSGAVMALFLDHELRVRWFTRGVGAFFPLTAADAGRRITDFAPRFGDRAFLDDVRAVMAEDEPREAEVATTEDRWFLRRIGPYRAPSGVMAGVAVTFTDISERNRVEAALRESERTLRGNQVWLAAQKEAFQSAMNGEVLEASLGILIRAAVEQAESECRCAFYIADAGGQTLRHVVGMPDSYARCVDGFEISPESLSCGLAVALGEPVITPDVLEEPRWQAWTWLARAYDYRGCWSFPIETSAGKLVGSFAMYSRERREPTSHDRTLAAALTQAGAIIIAHHRELEARARLSRALIETHEGREELAGP